MTFTRKSLAWPRVLCVAVTVVALFFLFRRINVDALRQAMRSMHPGWFLAAIALYGLLFLPAAWRWHLALRLNSSTVHFGVTTRVSLIGHFFYNILFGAAGGDTAKSALYSRWYGVPLPEVLVAASLDRLLGLGGLILFAGVAFGIAAMHGGFAGVNSFSLHWSGWWLLLIPVLILFILIALKRTDRKSILRRFAETFLQTGRRLISSPKTFLPGLLCGLLVQMALSGVLALTLQAVSHKPLPWLQLIWTFPAISVISALPVSVAGLGVRDTAAFALLGFCGVAGSDAVAASLLAAAASLTWTVIAGGVFWLEARRQQARRPSGTLSAIVPTLNPETSLAETVRQARTIREVFEIIVADSGSADRTAEVAAGLGCRFVPCAGKSPLLAGAEVAKGDVVLLIPIGAGLPENAGKAAMNALRDTSAVGGGFCPSKPLRLVFSLFGCGRIDRSHPIFLRRDVLSETGLLGSAQTVDDAELFRRLRKAGRWVLADPPAVALEQVESENETRERVQRPVQPEPGNARARPAEQS